MAFSNAVSAAAGYALLRRCSRSGEKGESQLSVA
jgi:hypothetical protein